MADPAQAKNVDVTSTAAPERFADPSAGGFFTRFMTGAQFAFSGLSFTLNNKQLRTLSAIPIAINLVLFVVFVVGGFFFVGDIVDWAHFFSADGESGFTYVLFWILEALWTGFLYLAVAVGVLLVGFLATVVVGNVVAGPIYDRLSEITEQLVLGRSTADGFSVKGLAKEVVEELLLLGVRLSIYAVGLLPILLLNLVPVVGSVLGSVLGALWTWIFLSLEVGNPSFVRHKIKGPMRVSHIFNHSAAHLGFGAASWLMLWVPITMPFLCVGATRLHLAFAAHNRAPNRLTDDDRSLLAG